MKPTIPAATLILLGMTCVILGLTLIRAQGRIGRLESQMKIVNAWAIFLQEHEPEIKKLK